MRRLSPISAVLVAWVLTLWTAGAPTPGPQASLAGHFLVADPSLEDPNFRRTVVYMIEHGSGGAMGLVVNRVVASGSLAELLRTLGIEAEPGQEAQIRIHEGGPVERGRAFVLHGDDYQVDDTVLLDGGLALTVSLDVLRDMAEGNGPGRSLFILGYAGWAPDQLESELARGSWVVVPADPELLFDPDDKSKWQRALDLQEVEL